MDAFVEEISRGIFYDADGLWVKNLEGHDPQEVAYALAQRRPDLSFAWEPRADKEGMVGRFKYDENHGPLVMCKECDHLYDEWWTDMVHEQCTLHSLVDYLEWRMSLDDVINTDALRLEKHRLKWLDPQDVLRALVKREPWMAYAWEPMEHPEDAGTIFLGRNNGEEEHCFECKWPQWTNWGNVPCGAHCDHPNSQCFPQGGCGCSCRGCEVVEDE